MSQTSKTLRRLCLATGVVTVAGVFPALAAVPAFASSVSNPTLSIANTAPSAVSTSTVSFAPSTSIPASSSSSQGYISIAANTTPAPGTGQTGYLLPTSSTDYSVSVNNVNDPIYTGTGTTTTTTTGAATLDVTNAIPAGASVVVTATGTTNPTYNSQVFDAVSTSTDVTALDSNAVQIGTATTPSTPVVNQVNPNTLATGTAVPFTITGSNFTTSTSSASPAVTFTPTNANQGGTAATATVTSYSANQITGTVTLTATADNATVTAPALAGPATYLVQVKNGDGNTSSSTAATSDTAKAVSGLTYTPESGQRAIDTRIGLGLPRGRVAANGSETFSLKSIEQAANIPTNATAVAMNVTAIGESGPGNLQVYSGSTAPGTSTVNFTTGVDTGNFSIVSTPLSASSNAGDSITVLDQGSAVNVTVDVVGYFTGAFTANNTRVLDTRPGASSSAGGGIINGPLAPRQVYSVQIPGVTTAGTTVALNVTAVDPSSVGNLRVFPEPSTGPSTSSVPNTAAVQYIPGTDTGSYLITQTGNGGKVDIYSDTVGSVNAVLDETGTVLAASAPAPGVVTLNPFRDYDSRPNGIGIRTPVAVTVGNTGTPSNGVPAGAFAAIASLSAIDPAQVGNLRTFPDGAAVPNTATINYFSGHDRQNLAIVALNNGAMDLYNDSNGMVNSTVDVTGFVGD